MDSGSVELRRSPRARRLSLRLDMAARQIVLTAPDHVATAEIGAFLARHRRWVERARAALPPPIPLAPGSVIPFRGRGHVIRHDPSWPRRPAVAQDVIRVGGPRDRLAPRLHRWLRETARAALLAAVHDCAARLSVGVGAVRLRDTKSRWGSCTAQGNLNFSWRLILAPPEVLRYVAAHEVAHRREMNHSPRFWRLVEELVGDYRAPRAWLHDHGPTLHAVVTPAQEGGA